MSNIFHNIRTESLPPVSTEEDRLAFFPPFDGYTVIQLSNEVIYSWDADTQTWISQSTGAGQAPGGPDQSFQFNDNGRFSGSDNFLWDPANEALEVNLIEDLRGTFTIDVGSRILYDDTSSIAISFSDASRFLYASDGESLDYNTRLLIDSGILPSLDWDKRQCIDDLGDIVADWGQQTLLYSGTNHASVDWRHSLLNDLSAIVSIDWNNRQLFNAFNIATIDYNSSYLFTQMGFVSIDWENGFLNDNIGNISANYQGRKFFSDTGSEVFSYVTSTIGINGGLAVNHSVLNLKDGHLTSTQTLTTTTVAANANAGSGASASLGNATDIAGFITLTAGSGSISTGTQLTVTFGRIYTQRPIIVITPTNANASIASLGFFVTGIGFGSFSIGNTSAITASQIYSWSYHVIETQS